MDKYYLFSEKVSHAVKVSITLAISLLLFAFGQAAVGHDSGFSPTGANAPNMLASNVDVGMNQLAALIPLTIKSGVNPDVVYNGTNAYTIDLDFELDGINAGDDVTLTEVTGTFADKNADDDKTFTITSYKLEGDDAAEYSLSTKSIKADVMPMELELKGITVDQTKAYDGTSNAKMTYATAYLSGNMIVADGVKLLKIAPAATYDTKAVGAGKAVIVSGFGINITNNNDDNYSIKMSSLTFTANITKRPLTVSVACDNKQFDSSTDADVTLTDNRVSGDVMTIAYTEASFGQEDAKIDIPVSVVGISISGTDAGNYTFNETASTTANITPKMLTISGVSAADKVYDDSNKAVLSGTPKLDGVLDNDEVTLVIGTGTFANEDAGENKDVTFSGYSITGIDNVNYTLSAQPPVVVADIEKMELKITAEASDKVYNANTVATVTFSDNRIAGDVIGIHSASVNFADKNVGVDKPISVSGIYIDGDDAANYTNNPTATADADITAIQLTISDVLAKDKKYDGQKTAVLDIDEADLVGDMIASDNVALNIADAIGNFDTKDAGVGKTVQMDGFKIDAPNTMNYIITQPSVIASITAKELSVDAIGVDKEYDGKTIAEVTLTPDPVDMVAGEVLTFTYNANFVSKNRGDQTVNVKDIAIAGVNAGNYALESTVDEVTAEITQKELSVITEAKDKVYDGDDDAEITLTPDPLDVAAGDVLTLAYTDANFTDKNAGDKTVNVEGITIKSGNEAGNYKLEKVTSTDDATITPKDLTVKATVNNKVYDSETDVAVNTVALASTDILEGDNLAYAFDKGTFSDANAGDRTVLVEGIVVSGTDALNYSLLNTTNTATAKITPKDLTVVAEGVNKEYDRATNAAVNFKTLDLVGDDVMGYDYTAAFATKNVDDDIVINVTGISIKGDEASNYSLKNITAITDANITPASLSIKGVTGADRMYNGNKVVDLDVTNAELVDLEHPELNLIALDNIKLIKTLAIGEFVEKTAGDARPIKVTGFMIDDQNDENYDLDQPIPTANIAPVRLRIKGVTAENKPYDGNTDAVLNTASAVLEGAFNGDEVALDSKAAKGTFKVKDVQDDQIISTSGFELTGADKANYTFTNPQALADIIPKELTLTAEGIDKTYDGLYTAEVKFGNWVESDNLSVTYTATFSDDNANKDIQINVKNIVIHGDTLGNYALASTTAIAEADIAPRSLKINGVKANNKSYDHTVLATLNNENAVLDVADVIAGDDLQLIKSGSTGTFEDYDAATAIAVATSGFDIEGDDAVNYALVQPASIADITPASLTITDVMADDKIYDGTTAVILKSDLAALEGVFASDDVTLISDVITGAFEDKKAGDDKKVIVNGFSIEGDDADNYSLVQPESVNADISTRILEITAKADNKEYDGTTIAIIPAGGFTLKNIVSSNEMVTVSAQSLFEDKDADDEIPVSVTGITLSGIDASNYSYNTETTTMADIIPAKLQVTGLTAANKVYDGSTVATLSDLTKAQLSGVKLTDKVALINYNVTSRFADKKVGTDKSVLTTGFDIEGLDVKNYDLQQPSPKASITPITLNITGVTASDKVYDGNATATLVVNSAAIAGSIIPLDDVKLNKTGATGTFANMIVGTAKVVTPTGFVFEGTDAGNYSVVMPAMTANITAKPMTITASSMSKCFGAVKSLMGTEFTPAGLVGTDAVASVTLTSNGTSADAVVGTSDIIASNAIGSGLSNYLITYMKGIMTVNPLAIQPAAFAVSTTSVCQGASAIAYSVPNDPTASYVWSYSGTGATITGTTNAITMNFSAAATSGILSVTANNACGIASIARTMTITASPVMATPAVTIDAVLQVTMTSNATVGNQWYNTAGAITGATNQTYTATANGAYYSMVTGACSTVKSNTVTVTHVSVPEFEKPTISLYPNPNTGEFWLKFKASGNEKLKMIQVFNRLGNVVYQAIPASVSNDLTEWITINNQSAGVYILVLTTNNQRISRQIVITK